MITEAQIQSAIAAGILDETTANSLKKHVSTTPNANFIDNADEEHFQLVTGFNDIFVVIASWLLLLSINWIGGAMLGSVLAAAVSWGLAEFFVRKRRMALPAIVLLLAFVGNVFYGALVSTQFFIKSINYEYIYNPPALFIAPALIAMLAAWLHWLRFKVPITVAAGSAALVGGVLAAVLALPFTKELALPIAVVAGLAVFAFAMRWDSLDTSRQTRKSDVGFWLHLLAAPLIIHPVFSLLGVLQGAIEPAQAAVVLALYIGIAVISLLIDRRALMVSALGYVVYVFSMLLNNLGHIELGFAITAFVIGSALLMLSAFWHTCRHYLMSFIPANLSAYLPITKD